MSRPDKRFHRERIMGTAKDESVQLYAFANTRPTYQVCFSPESPMIVLKSKRSAKPQHPCEQWEPLSDLVFGAQPDTTHAVYLVDTTALSCKPGLEREEEVNGIAVGATLKQLSNVVARLNPHNAILVAAGASSLLALKYMLVGEKTLGHRDRLVEKLVLVCPPSPQEIMPRSWLVLGSATAQDASYPRPSIVVLVRSTAEVHGYQQWLSECITSGLVKADGSYVTDDLAPSLFAAVARHAAGVEAGAVEAAADTNRRFGKPRVYRIHFALSKDSKAVEQFPVLSPLVAPDEESEGAADPSEDAGSVEDMEEGERDDRHVGGGAGRGAAQVREGHSHAGEPHACCAAGSCEGSCAGEEDVGSTVYVAGISGLQQWREPVRVMVEGRVLNLSEGLVGTTEGCVTVEGLADLVGQDSALLRRIAEGKSGAVCVALATRILRDKYGRTTLRALEVRGMTRREERHSMTVGDTVEDVALRYHVSEFAHSVGAVLIRGRKCALVRDRSGGGAGVMRLPHQPLSDSNESAMDCAVRALCEACEVSSDNMFFPAYLAPVVYYPKGSTDVDGRSMTRCVTLFIALAVSGPPRGPAADAREDLLDPSEPYDWVSFPAALALLGSAEERAALVEVRDALAKAAAAGIYSPVRGCGMFGESVRGSEAITGPAAAAAAVTAAPATAPGAAVEESSLDAPLDASVELVVVLCPGGQQSFSFLQDAVVRALGAPELCVLSGAEGVEAAVRGAARAGARTAAVLLDQDGAGVESFCEQYLAPLLENHGVRSRLLTVLSLSACERVADLRAETMEARVELVSHIVLAAMASDLLWVPSDDAVGGAEVALWALLSACASANPDVTCVRWVADRVGGGCAPERIPLDEVHARATACGPASTTLSSTLAPHGGLRYVVVEQTEADTPCAPAALAYLMRPNALDAFYTAGETFLMSLEGVAWVATRPRTQGLLSLDMVSRCLEVDGGDDWAVTGEQPHSRLRMGVLCAAGEAAETRVRALALTLFQQLLWSKERDGAVAEKLRDPLPTWD